MQSREPIPSNAHIKTSSMHRRILFALGTTHMPQHTMQHAAPDVVQSVASDVVHKCDVSLFPSFFFPRQSPTAYADASARVNLIKHPHNNPHLRARGGLAYLRHTFINAPCNASRSAFFRLSAFALLRLFFGVNIRSERAVFAPKRKPAINCALL